MVGLAAPFLGGRDIVTAELPDAEVERDRRWDGSMQDAALAAERGRSHGGVSGRTPRDCRGRCRFVSKLDRGPMSEGRIRA
jgi:hypothetical protein